MNQHSSPKYLEHLDTIVALITHLGLTNRKSRTIPNLSKSLSLENDKVESALNGFPGLFRKSAPDRTTGEIFYTLQYRYATRWMNSNAQTQDEDDPDPILVPLDSDALSALLTFVTNMVNNELEDSRSNRTNSIAVLGTVIASVAALIVSFISLFAN